MPKLLHHFSNPIYQSRFATSKVKDGVVTPRTATPSRKELGEKRRCWCKLCTNCQDRRSPYTRSTSTENHGFGNQTISWKRRQFWRNMETVPQGMSPLVGISRKTPQRYFENRRSKPKWFSSGIDWFDTALHCNTQASSERSSPYDNQIAKRVA